jgi:hypothetical protein
MRIARLISAGRSYHVISRFVDRGWYFHDDEERACYLRLFNRAVEQTGWKWLCFALMSNHIHHGLIAGEAPLSALFKAVHSPFSRWMNERRGRIGPLFADRPAAWEIRPMHVPRMLAYIHNNPVRAGVVAAARDSDWTSHRCYLGLDRGPSRLDVDAGLDASGLSRAELDAFVAADVSGDPCEPLDGIHRAARRRGAVELGTPLAQPTVAPIVMRPFARVRPGPRAVLEVVAHGLGVAVPELASRAMTGDRTAGRRIAVHAGLSLGLTASDMGTALGISRQAAARIAKRALSDSETATVLLVRSWFTEVPPSPAK